MDLPARDPEILLTYDGFVRLLAQSLVSEGHRADDVAQETWLAALEHGPRNPRSLRAWLAALVRNFAAKLESSERARVQREHAVARPEAVPSTQEILEREAARRSVVNAVVELDEPYRSVVLLRYFEHLPPREIARRLSVPVETVRTQTRRALEQLRGKLDHEHREDRRAWASLLLSLTQFPPPLPLATATITPASLLPAGGTLLGVLAMSVPSKVAIAAALLVCSSIVFWQLSVGPAPEPVLSAGEPGEAAAASATRAPQRDLAAGAPEPATRREVASAPAPESRAVGGTGSLFVRILWASDKTPGAGLIAWVTPRWRVSPLLERIEVESGADGTFRIPVIAAGSVTVSVVRGGEKRVVVERGKEAEVTIEIPRGFPVTGTVVRPGGEPVGGAEIWLSPLRSALAGRVATRSAADGTFRLRDVMNPSLIGAIEPGRARSPLIELFDRKGHVARDEVHVCLTVRDGVGEVGGRVLDPTGSPVTGALAILGKDRSIMTKEGGEIAMAKDGGTVPAFLMSEMKTDGAGTFRFHTIPAGKHEVTIRAKAFAPWLGTVEVSPGSFAALEVRLVKGVTLTGTVKDSAGKTVQGCEVTLEDDTPVNTSSAPGRVAASIVRTDAQGTFRLEALAPGRLEVKATTQDRGSAKTVLTAADGDAVRWDAVLSGGLALRGRVIDHLGAPIPEWWVSGEPETAPLPPAYRGYAKTDQEGRFRITNLMDLPHLVELRGDGSSFPQDVRSGVRPGEAEVTFRIAAETRMTASITGAVVDAEDRPLDATVWLHQLPNGRTDVGTDPATGRFKFSVPPGRYALRYVHSKALNPSHRTIPTFFAGEQKLETGETWDLGNLRVVPGGTLRVTAKCEAGLDVAKAGVSLGWGNQYFDSAMLEGGIAHWSQAGGAGDRVLAAGSYRLQVAGEGFARAIHTFEIRSGAETHVELSLRRGIKKTLVVENAEPEPRGAAAHLTLHDSEGKLVFDAPWRWLPTSKGVATRIAWFSPGTYRARATMDSLAGEVEFRVLAGAADDETVRVVLK